MAGRAALRAALVAATSDPARTARTRLRVRLLLARYRRLVVAGLVALAATAAIDAVRPAAPAGPSVLVAAHDLPAGHRLAPADLVARPWGPGTPPDGLVPEPSGRTLAAPVRRGEPLTDARVSAPGAVPWAPSLPASRPGRSAPAPAGSVVVSVRLGDPASALVAEPGGRVDVVAGGPVDPVAGRPAGAATVVARDALVLAVPAGDGPSPAETAAPRSGGTGLLGALTAENGQLPDRSSPDGSAGGVRPPAGVVLVAVPPADALRLASISGVRTLSLARHAALGG
jgi:Flp pilus assembly protein CpaB